MKYSCHITIDAPIDRVIDYWSNEEYCGEWQDGFQSIELLSGTKGKEGAVSRIKFLNKGRKMELIETIITNKLPHYVLAEYDHKHMKNTQRTIFQELNDGRTEYTTEVEYLEFKKWMVKIMATLFPGMFRKMSEKWMLQFKNFVEKRKSE